MHIPTCESSLLDIVGFDEALAASGSSGDYDSDKWLYVPDYYTDYRYILGTRGKDPLICIGINPSTAAPGEDITVFDTRFGRMGVEICFDIRFPELTRAMAKRGAEVILCPAQFNMTTGPRHWELSVSARAMDNELFFVGASAARYNGFDYECWGHSTVADPFGMVRAACDETEQILYCNIDLNEVDYVREQLPTFLHLREDVYNVAK